MKTVNSIMKRILTVGLTVVLLAGSAPANVYAESIADPVTPFVTSTGMEESEKPVSDDVTGTEVPETESADELSGQTIDDKETNVISNEDETSTVPEEELTDEEAASEPEEVLSGTSESQNTIQSPVFNSN